MAYREFTDPQGRSWRAWDTYPQNPQVVAPGFESGWLSFESDAGKWRLAPVPEGWAAEPDARLLRLLSAARGEPAPGPAPLPA